MDGMLQPPSATAFDALASSVSLLVYLGVALAAIVRSPADARTRTFLGVALASAIPYTLSPLQWWKGYGVYTPAVIALTTVAFTVGAATLFHFTQVFPRRRPFITAHFRWVAAAYLLPVPLWALAWAVGVMLTGAVADVATTGSGGLGAVSSELSPAMTVVVLVLMVPARLLGGVLLPFAGLLSLVKSWREARTEGRARDRSATLCMLVSQLGGGVLSILVLPMLHLIGVGPPWSVGIAALSYAFALLLPLAFARYEFSTSGG
jgi:hypothetical protein